MPGEDKFSLFLSSLSLKMAFSILLLFLATITENRAEALKLIASGHLEKADQARFSSTTDPKQNVLLQDSNCHL